MNTKGYEELANAIVLQAVTDYRTALKALAANPDDRYAKYEAKRIEQFFLSAWYRCLTEIDGKWLMMKLKKEAAEL